MASVAPPACDGSFWICSCSAALELSLGRAVVELVCLSVFCEGLSESVAVARLVTGLSTALPPAMSVSSVSDSENQSRCCHLLLHE